MARNYDLRLPDSSNPCAGPAVDCGYHNDAGAIAICARRGNVQLVPMKANDQPARPAIGFAPSEAVLHAGPFSYRLSTVSPVLHLKNFYCPSLSSACGIGQLSLPSKSKIIQPATSSRNPLSRRCPLPARSRHCPNATMDTRFLTIHNLRANRNSARANTPRLCNRRLLSR